MKPIQIAKSPKLAQSVILPVKSTNYPPPPIKLQLQLQ